MDDIRLTFDRVPEQYDRVRPLYPEVLFDELFDRLGPSPAIVEVGPGTGQATGALLSRGARVTAVELGPSLAAALAAKYSSAEGLLVVNEPFESAALGSKGFDAVVSASAYHWIEPQQRLRRPHDLLRPDGLLAIVELIQVGSSADGGYFDRVQPIYESFGDSRHDWNPPTHDAAMPAIVAELEASALFADPEVHRVTWDQTYTSAQYRDLLYTYSGTQMFPSEQRHDLVDQLVAVVDADFDGTVTRPLVATMTLARVR